MILALMVGAKEPPKRVPNCWCTQIACFWKVPRTCDFEPHRPLCVVESSPTDPNVPKNSKTRKSTNVTFGVPVKVTQKGGAVEKVTFGTLLKNF